MKFRKSVKLVVGLSALMVMLAGLLVFSAEAGPAITDAELNAFFESGPKPGAAASKWTLYDDNNIPLIGNGINVAVYGWDQFNSKLEDEIEFKNPLHSTQEFEDALKILMAEAKSEGVNKAYFTFYEFSGELEAVDDENPYNHYSMGTYEAILKNNLEEVDKEGTELKSNPNAFRFSLEENDSRVAIITLAANQAGKSDDSGCNAGFGMIALLLAGFLTRKFRKA